jgi:hypothetical protein
MGTDKAAFRVSGLAIVAVMTVACGGSSDRGPADDSKNVPAAEKSDPSAAVPVGRYVTSSPGNPGDPPISELLFYDTANLLVTFAPCPTGEPSCVVHATYQFDPAQHTLSITDDLTKKTLSGPLEPSGVSSPDPSLTAKSLDPLNLFDWVGDSLLGVGNFFLSGFKWVGRNLLGISDGFSGNQFNCQVSSIMNDGRMVSVPPDLSSQSQLHLTTSRAWGGYPQIMTDTLNGKPVANATPHLINNGWAQTNSGAWVATDSSLLAGRAGTVTYYLPQGGPAQYACSPSAR